MRATSVGVVAGLCLVFTVVVAPVPAWADDSHGAHRAVGAALRAGTVVGQSTFAGNRYTTLGGAVAVGAHRGRLGAELEVDYLTLQSDGPASTILGAGHRIAGNLRLDVIRIGRRWLGADSLLGVWIELGAGWQRTEWRAPELGPGPGADRLLAQRMETLSSRPERTDTAAGAGWRLDHRWSRGRALPRRIGWLLGWRVTRAPGLVELADLATVDVARCRGAACRPPAIRRSADLGLLLHSSLVVSW